MGTVCEITADAPPEAIDAAFDEIDRIEKRISTWRPDSELSRLNHATLGMRVPVSDELRTLLTNASDWSRRTNGAFTPLIGSLVDAWKIRDEGELPDRNRVARAVALADISKLKIDDASVTRLDDIEIEEGAFGKGYAIDRALDVLRARGARNATINFGGQLAVFKAETAPEARLTVAQDEAQRSPGAVAEQHVSSDSRRSPGGAIEGGSQGQLRGPRSTEIAIADPSQRDRAAVSIHIANASVSTSSGSENQFTIGGRTFTHIIDPRTGEALPPRGSVTVVSPSAFEADILSTALYVMGPDDGLRWADSNGVAAIFITPDREVRQTKPAHERLDARVVAPEFQLKD